MYLQTRRFQLYFEKFVNHIQNKQYLYRLLSYSQYEYEYLNLFIQEHTSANVIVKQIINIWEQNNAVVHKSLLRLSHPFNVIKQREAMKVNSLMTSMSQEEQQFNRLNHHLQDKYKVQQKIKMRISMIYCIIFANQREVQNNDHLLNINLMHLFVNSLQYIFKLCCKQVILLQIIKNFFLDFYLHQVFLEKS
ncbi:hypothetical protein FGO68_gene14663 [Halteria grandinella]|uniref:Uncharacterized protein n=1 Tax=Halteria grandinella TaxID=5974 RepID=A0A8J8NI24_HALGN|nr:hypothetical protein FGO68_gene14663 [Halteria grandinella]